MEKTENFGHDETGYNAVCGDSTTDKRYSTRLKVKLVNKCGTEIEQPAESVVVL